MVVIPKKEKNRIYSSVFGKFPILCIYHSTSPVFQFSVIKRTMAAIILGTTRGKSSQLNSLKKHKKCKHMGFSGLCTQNLCPANQLKRPFEFQFPFYVNNQLNTKSILCWRRHVYTSIKRGTSIL